ncbi:MAG TPA: hypothetical protein VKD90_05640 [Gemmataceae bacterium]|nr:hypothetical protein [Gemmataceae bacterium]
MPSANRERAIPFRTNRDYFHRQHPVGSWKIRLAAVALVATGGWLAAGLVDRARLHRACTHGPLAQAHAPWADRCDACHAPHGAADSAGIGVFGTRDRWRSFRCDTCHPGSAADPKDYAPHYDLVKKPYLRDDAQARDCSSCHHDHMGADASLMRVADTDCTRCHRDLSALGGTGPRIAAFHRDHPEFRAKADEPARRLKFNHALHLAVGLTEPKNRENPNARFKLDQVEPMYRQQYGRYATSEATIHLDCAACHEPAGGGYKPVTFERHCQGCHAQTVSGLQSPGGVTTKPFVVPHGQSSVEVDRFVRAELLRQIEDQKGILRAVPLPPSDRLDTPRVAVPSDLGRETAALAKMAAGLLTCQKCHTTDGGGRIQPTGTPAGWLPRAQFDHTSHRAVRCAECHTTWNEGPVLRGAGPEPLNVPGIDNCRRCHAPTSSTGGGVRHGCVDCHRYHAGARREPPADRRLPVESFLRGTP